MVDAWSSGDWYVFQILTFQIKPNNMLDKYNIRMTNGWYEPLVLNTILHRFFMDDAAARNKKCQETYPPRNDDISPTSLEGTPMQAQLGSL